MQLNMNIDLEKKLMTYTHLTFGSDGDNYVSQISKKIKYKITLPEEEGSREFYAWSAQTAAQTLNDNKRDLSYQDVYCIFNKKNDLSHRYTARLKGTTIEQV